MVEVKQARKRVTRRWKRAEEWWDIIVEWAKGTTGDCEKDTLSLFWVIQPVLQNLKIPDVEMQHDS